MKLENYSSVYLDEDFDISKVRPINYNVLVMVKEFSDKFSEYNGLVVFEYRRYDNYGKVLKISDKVKKKYGEIYNIKEGDIVFISNPAAGTCVKRKDGYSYILIPIIALEYKVESV